MKGWCCVWCGAWPAGVVALGSLLPVARDQLWQVVVAVLGFMTYKVALVSVALTTPVPRDLVKANSSASASSRSA
jgi:hypothetical protein